MNSPRLTTALTVCNLALVVFLLSHAPAGAQDAAAPAPFIRASGLEIVDAHGRVRASITVNPPTTVEGRDYAETVLLRLTDPTSGPVVKLTAARNGAALGLSDDADGGIQLYARDTGSFARVVAKDGAEAVLKP